MKFKIGDPVWCETNRTEFQMVGKKAAVVIGFSDKENLRTGEKYEYVVEIYGYFKKWGDGQVGWLAHETWLSPRRDPDAQRREELGSWDLCPWQPESYRIKARVEKVA